MAMHGHIHDLGISSWMGTLVFFVCVSILDSPRRIIISIQYRRIISLPNIKTGTTREERKTVVDQNSVPAS
jgi:hypothetical protein